MKGFQILRSDFIRREILEEKDIFDEKVASSSKNRRMVYEEMFKRAEAMLKEGTEGIGYRLFSHGFGLSEEEGFFKASH